MPNPLDFLFYKPDLPTPRPGVKLRTPAEQEVYAQAELAKQPLGQQVFRKSLEALGNLGKGLFADPAMPREEFEQTGPAERLGMLAAAAPFGPTGIKGLYSRVNKAIKNFPGKQINANRALSLLRNQASKEELDYRGLSEFLQGKQGQTVPVEEIQAFAEQNPLQMKITTYPRTISKFKHYRVGEPTRYDRYTLPGGEKYREQVIQLDKPIPKTPDERAKEIWAAAGVEYPGWYNLTAVEQQNVLSDLKYYEMRDPNTYRSSHWSDPNPLAHVRFNERVLPSRETPIPSDLPSDWTPEEYQLSKGSRGRFLEEVQSDWHEAGRDQGYLTLERERQRLGMVPDAPFKEDWPDLVLKQQLMEVAERPDLDWLGFTTGQTQVDRYDLSQVANRLIYDPQQRVLETYGPDMAHTGTFVVEKPEDLIPLIGKDAADRLLRSQVPDSEFPQAASGPLYQLAGEDLQIGGTGMFEFYDKQLPRKLEKILAPFGGRVEKGQLPVPSTFFANPPTNQATMDTYSPEQWERLQEATANNSIEMWYTKLSPEMKAAIREKGLPLLMALLAAEFGDNYDLSGDSQ